MVFSSASSASSSPPDPEDPDFSEEAVTSRVIESSNPSDSILPPTNPVEGSEAPPPLDSLAPEANAEDIITSRVMASDNPPPLLDPVLLEEKPGEDSISADDSLPGEDSISISDPVSFGGPVSEACVHKSIFPPQLQDSNISSAPSHSVLSKTDSGADSDVSPAQAVPSLSSESPTNIKPQLEQTTAATLSDLHPFFADSFKGLSESRQLGLARRKVDKILSSRVGDKELSQKVEVPSELSPQVEDQDIQSVRATFRNYCIILGIAFPVILVVGVDRIRAHYNSAVKEVQQASATEKQRADQAEASLVVVRDTEFEKDEQIRNLKTQVTRQQKVFSKTGTRQWNEIQDLTRDLKEAKTEKAEQQKTLSHTRLQLCQVREKNFSFEKRGHASALWCSYKPYTDVRDQTLAACKSVMNDENVEEKDRLQSRRQVDRIISEMKRCSP